MIITKDTDVITKGGFNLIAEACPKLNVCFLICFSNIQPFTCYFKDLPAIDLRSEDACAKQRYYTRSFRMRNVDDV